MNLVNSRPFVDAAPPSLTAELRTTPGAGGNSLHLLRDRLRLSITNAIPSNGLLGGHSSNTTNGIPDVPGGGRVSFACTTNDRSIESCVIVCYVASYREIADIPGGGWTVKLRPQPVQSTSSMSSSSCSLDVTLNQNASCTSLRHSRE